MTDDVHAPAEKTADPLVEAEADPLIEAEGGEDPAPESQDGVLGTVRDHIVTQGRRLPALAAIGVLLAILLYYPVGAWRFHVIDDDANFVPSYQNGQSLSVAIAAALIHREVDIHGWVANKPFFMPAAILDDMPNYQIGIIAATARFAQSMNEAKQGVSEPSTADADLDHAADLLRYAPDVWHFDQTSPWNTVPSSDKQYRNAGWALENYNHRLIAGETTLPQGAGALRHLAERAAEDMEAVAAGLSRPIGPRGDWRSDKAFWQAKGHAYAQFLMLRGLGADYADLLAERGQIEAWSLMLAELQHAAAPRPWFVTHGSDDSLFLPNHLANEGFHLLRAHAELMRIAEALR
jgi:hypothetical protein